MLTIVGSDLHLVLVRMLKAQFGIDDPKELGITVRNINAITELGRAQPGIDAVLCARARSRSRGGERGRPRHAAAQQRHAPGPPTTVRKARAKARRSRASRRRRSRRRPITRIASGSVVRQDFLAANPKVVTAMMIANQRAVDALVKAGTDARSSRSAAPNWPGTPDAQTRMDRHHAVEAARLVVDHRRRRAHAGRAVDHQGDLPAGARSGRREEAVRARCAASRRRPTMRSARFRHAASFDDSSKDTRGKPVWEVDSWNLKV